jgi:hypothetical protein
VRRCAGSYKCQLRTVTNSAHTNPGGAVSLN